LPDATSHHRASLMAIKKGGVLPRLF